MAIWAPRRCAVIVSGPRALTSLKGPIDLAGSHVLSGLEPSDQVLDRALLLGEFCLLRRPELFPQVAPSDRPRGHVARYATRDTYAELRRGLGAIADVLRADGWEAVVVADDNALIREGLAALLRESGMDVVAKCANPDELLAAVQEHAPDAAIVDVRMPPTHTDEGLQAAWKIRSGHPGTGVLILSQYVEVGLAMKLLAESAEGLGYLLKDRVTDLDEFTDALRRVAAGGSALDPVVVTQLLARERPDDLVETLTPREREVLELMAAGSSNQGIAERLEISVGVVEKYASSIFEKLGLPTARTESRRVLAVLAFLRA